MKRHILLRRQRRYFRLTPSFLKKRRPLVKRILERQEVLAALSFHSTQMEDRISTIQTGVALPWTEEAAEPLDIPVALEEEQSPVTTEETILPVTAEENALPTAPEENIFPVTVEEKKLPAPGGKRKPPLPIIEQPLEKEKISATPLSQLARTEAADGATKKAPLEAQNLERAVSALPVSQVEFSSASEEQAASAIFDDRQSTFDPQYWLARLTEMAQREQQQRTAPEQSVPGRQIPPRTPKFVSQGTRKFLKPLVGIDPASVPVYQDKRAAQETGALRADALNVGETIELAPDYTDGTSETLGLLAHELTHVARKRQPHFVPPIMRPPTSTTGETLSMPASIGEEALALEVERQVRHVARSEDGSTLPVIPFQPAWEQMEVPEEMNSHRDRSFWGELPAPWEPLPAWLAYPPTADGTLASPPSQTSIAPIPHLSAPSPAYGSVQQGIGGDSSAPGEVMRASADRDLEDAPASSQPSQPQPAHKAPEPDLNEMAQQVYERLKRRLLVEQQRELN